jgi:hypothetical protein
LQTLADVGLVGYPNVRELSWVLKKHSQIRKSLNICVN